jgi:hypothetical protein
MTRQVRRLDSKAVRSKLKVREAPYWVRCGARGRHLGYRRLQGGFGTWLAKTRNRGNIRRWTHERANAARGSTPLLTLMSSSTA